MNKIKVMDPLMNMGGRFKSNKAEDKKMDPPTPVVPTTPEMKHPRANDPQLMFFISISAS